MKSPDDYERMALTAMSGMAEVLRIATEGDVPTDDEYAVMMGDVERACRAAQVYATLATASATEQTLGVIQAMERQRQTMEALIAATKAAARRPSVVPDRHHRMCQSCDLRFTGQTKQEAEDAWEEHRATAHPYPDGVV